MDTFKILSTFYDYYDKNYDWLHEQGYDVHTTLAKFLMESNVNVNDDLSKIMNFVVLRDNAMDHFFQNGKLKSGVSYRDLINEHRKWCDEKWKRV
jgi:hypothetical protein